MVFPPTVLLQILHKINSLLIFCALCALICIARQDADVSNDGGFENW